ncbi:transferrin-binding protein-like solute binding protein [uncultured Shimia sp.]|uniref:transferrin-binding protein-like solute binding protein n=1 Tax=uncultured Shimia sp. TaxID=573152 RepID=UPI00262721EF|nr:transferrin-binding protein-like solute binding protein [uncultured Shimia sp.]
MFAQFPKAALLPILATTLSSCGGGSTSPVPFTSTSELPADGTAELQGQAYTAAYTTNSADGTTTYGEPSDTQGSSLAITFKNGEQIAISGSAGNSKFDIDTRDGDEIYARENSTYYTTDADSRDDGDVAYLSQTNSNDLDHLVYGAWYDLDRSNPTTGAGHYGAATPKPDMPNSGSASYRGKGLGIANHDGIHSDTNFDVTVTTSDFSTISVQSSNTTWTDGAYKKRSDGTYQLVHDASTLDFSGTGQIDGAGFNANLTSAAGSGTATGSFYGPNAEEVGGSFAISGSGSTHIGAFGASR